MNGLSRIKPAGGFLAVLVLVFVSRLPFLLPGFGSEEDAWGLYYIARKVALSGQYEVSRLPGHPLQEGVYILLWRLGPLAFNLLTAVFATVATGFFMATLQRLKVANERVAGMAFAFIPVVYVNSCNAMDYLWALAFIMWALWLVAGGRTAAAGICLGLAAGCRITSLAMLVPLFFLLPADGLRWRRVVRLAVAAAASSLAVYAPVLWHYGLSFFGYTAQIPVSFVKAAFLATLGVWGVPGFVDLVLAVVLLVLALRRPSAVLPDAAGRLVRCSLAAIAVFVATFLALPQKAAFLIPALPFVITLMAVYLRRRILIAFSFSMIFSSFFVGITLDHPARGAPPSRWSYRFRVGDRPVALDLLRGPVTAEQVRRRNKIAFARSVVRRVWTLDRSSVVIAGFWSSDVLALADSLPPQVRLVYFVPEDSLAACRRAGAAVYFLPEMDEYNDRAFNGRFTARYGRLLDPEGP